MMYLYHKYNKLTKKVNSHIRTNKIFVPQIITKVNLVKINHPTNQ